MQHAKWATAVGINGADRLNAGLLPTLNLFFKSAEKRDAIKQGMPVSCKPLFHRQYTFVA